MPVENYASKYLEAMSLNEVGVGEKKQQVVGG